MAMVEQQLPQGFLAWTPPSVTDSELEELLRVQNRYIVTSVIRQQLGEDGVTWLGGHGRSPSLFTHEAIAERRIPDVVDTITGGCAALRRVATEEMDALIQTLDLSDTHINDSYMRVLKNMTDSGMNFGRIVSVFFFSYVLCKRLHKDGRHRLIESVVEWLMEYLNESINPWLESNHNGEWVSRLAC